jgi:hypothetical protein
MDLNDMRDALAKATDLLRPIASELDTLTGGTATKMGMRTGLTKADYFKIYRSYRMNEQQLLHHRLTWNLAIQGLLFGAYGFSVQKWAEVESGEGIAKAVHSMPKLLALLEWVPVVGVTMSLCILFAVVGAFISLLNLDKSWRKLEEKYEHLKDPYLPNPKGGGSNWAFTLGIIPPFISPIAFMVAWILIARAH